MIVYDSSLSLKVETNNLFTCNDQFLAVSNGSKTITVCNLSNLHETIDLNGHHGELTSMCFNDDFDNGGLCSAADEIIFWKTADIKLALLTKEFVQGVVLSLHKNRTNCLTMSKDGLYIGACCEEDIKIYSTEVNDLVITLKHFGKINNAMFVCQELVIIAISNDNMLRMWETRSGSLLCNFDCKMKVTSIENYEKTVLFGSFNGLLRIYEYSRGGKMKVFHEHDLKKYCLDEGAARVLFIKHYHSGLCFIGMPQEVLQVNVESCQTKVLFRLTESLVSIDGTSHYLSSLDQIVISRSVVPGKVLFVMEANDNELHLVSYWMDEQDSKFYQETDSVKMKTMTDGVETSRDNHLSYETEYDNLNIISVISRTPLISNSILKSELKVKAKPPINKVASKGLKQGNMDKTGKILDKQPLVFHKNIKSSGYVENKKGHLKLEKETLHSLTEELQFPSSQEFIPNLSQNQHVLDVPNVSFKSILKISETSSPINKLSFSGNGNMLLCSSTDGIISLLKRKNNSYFTEKAFHAHSHMINQVKFSNDSKWFISCGDEQAFVFDSKKCSPALTLNHKCGNLSSSAQPNKLKTLTGHISHAQFYYLDKFILLTHDNEILLYAYYMDNIQTDLKRHTANSKYKLIHNMSMQCKQITSFSAINSFYSYIGLCCGSDKSLCVIDFNVGSIVARFEDIHSRSAHTIGQYKGTGDLSYSSSPNDLFITSAISDGIKLWDLRSKRCEKTFREHRNRMHPCGVEFSPSGRYITTGSEDGQVYIYDIRQGLVKQDADRVTHCLLTPSFDPKTSEVLYSTLTGEIIFYGHHNHDSRVDHRYPAAPNKLIH